MSTSSTGHSLAPLPDGERLQGIDVLRGFAILGIFLVNIPGFASPIADHLVNINPMANDSTANQLTWAVIRALAEFKFVSTFSLLFGAGLAMQMLRAQARGRRFGPTYLRRLFVLAVFGVLHLLFLWWGDILLLYAAIGLVAFLLRNLKPQQLLGTAAVLMVVSFLFFGGVSALSLLGVAIDENNQPMVITLDLGDGDETAIVADESGQPPALESIAADPPAPGSWERFVAAYETASESEDLEGWREVELIAYRDGPLKATVVTRATTYALIVGVFTIVSGFGLRILALFLAGMALMRWGFFESGNGAWQRRLAIWGFAIGLPGEIIAVSCGIVAGDNAGLLLFGGELLHNVTSVFLCLGYVGGVTLLATVGPRWLTTGLAAVGRMALTNYILQSVVATFLMTWWGLRLFDVVELPTLVGLVLLIYVAQVAISVLWLRFFVMGPLEWAWRALTYLRPSPFIRRRSTAT